MFTTILILLVLIVGATGVYIWRRPQTRQRGRFYVFRCPRCNQKVRYLAAKAGRGGMCPRCGERWTLPAMPQNVQGSDPDHASYLERIGERRMPADSRPLRASRRAG
ncbi:MAG TPA: hypothetical protein VK395_04370 [Gemmataceae bacterium]|nr:hypothetical protein [Gemmataceae bacterium]